MKKWLLLVLLAVVGLASWFFLVTKKKPKEEVPKDQPVAVSRYSAAFNASIDSFLNTYYGLSEELVNWDSTAVSATAANMDQIIDKIRWDELKNDTVIYATAASYRDEVKNAVQNLTDATNLMAKRQAFHSLSQNMYDLLRTIKFDGSKIYLQQCPMAFNETEEGLWLSKTEKIRNPYLGLHHPKYKGSMISCGETKDTLHF